MARKKILSVALAAVLSVSTVFGSSPQLYQMTSVNAKENSNSKQDTEETEVVVDAEQVNASDYGLCDNSKDGVILHAFCWSFNTIKENMKDIAEAGYTTVQTSPINECLVGEGGGMDLMGNGKWYFHYQPTDWKIGNYQLGTRDQYKAMCDEADKYGVKIISDVLPNHTTPTLSAVSKDLANAAGGMGAGQLYHSNGFNEIRNYTDRYECTLGQMGGLPDVNTENQGFQEYYLKFCNDVIACGGDGFRYDTAKHIGVPSDPKDASNSRGVNDFWDVATGKKAVNGVSLSNPDKLFIYGEVLQDQGIPYQEYASYMNMTASGYGGKLRGCVGSKNFGVNSISGWDHATPDRIVTWVESHDTYCNEGESVWMTNQQIRACWAIIAARKQGTPLFLSRPMGSTNTKDGRWGNNKIGARGNDEFKHPEVVACNKFRNAMVGESEYMSNFGGQDCLVIERGTKGAVVINLGSQKSNVKLNKVADGTYTEQVSGKQVEVSGGVLKYDVAGGSVAVICNLAPVTKSPSVSVSKDSGDFYEPFDLKLTPSNATKATYSINGGDAVEFTKETTVKIGKDAEIGDKITVKVTAEGEGDPFSKTYTYTMTEEPELPEYKMMLRVKKSDFASAPNLYLYDSADKALNGAWPGTAMTQDGDYYVFTSDSLDKATAILVSGDWRSTADMQPGLAVSGYMEYDKASNKFSTFTLPVKTKVPVKETEAPVKETEAPAKETEAPAKETETPVEKTEAPTKKPENTEPAKTTQKPDEPDDQSIIKVSKEDGTSFSTETMDVKITLPSGMKGTYSVDNGPEQSFTSSATVEVGKGKIANREVSLKIKADGKVENYTYKKDFDPAKATVKTSAVSKIKSLFEIVSDATEVNGAAETGGLYATNPSGFGKEATITIDGSFSDWSEDMLIAQCGAWDIANAWKGGHENCVLDCYSLYGAWDDENLYIGWQMVNTADTWANSGDGPLSDGGRVLDVPLIVALNVGTGEKMTGATTDGSGIWGAGITFDTRVDHLLYMSGKPGLGNPGFFKAAGADGLVDYENKDSCSLFKEKGISYKMAEGCLPKTIMALEGSQSVDDAYDASAYKDMMAKGHNTTYDSFYEINIPLSELGITKADLESNGIGAMVVATRGLSGIDCIPHDPSMLDNVSGDCAVDPSTSHEKDDEDTITVPLAAIGNAKAGGEGGNITPTTKAPAKTEESADTEETEAPVDVEKTKVPAKTEEVKETEAPAKTEEVKETKQPEKTASAEPTKAPAVPTATEKVTPKATKKPVSGPDYNGSFTVNFGADRSSPQYRTTGIVLKAVPYGGSGDYTYEFKVDGTTIQAASDLDNCQWKGTEGSHKISVIVKDGDGAQITCEKMYDLEPKSGSTTETEKETELPQETKKPVVTDMPSIDNSGKEEIPSGNVTEKLTMSAGANKKSPQAAGTKIKLSIDAKGGTAPYKYTITVEGEAYGSRPNVLVNKSSSNSCEWTPINEGTYTVNFTVEDSKGDIVTQRGSFKISSSVSISKFTANKYTIKKGKKVKFSMAAISTLASSKNIKYQISVLKSGTSAKKIIRKFTNSKSYSWKATKKGKYTVYLTAKDTTGNTKTVKLSKKITVK